MKKVCVWDENKEYIDQEENETKRLKRMSERKMEKSEVERKKEESSEQES